MASQHSWHPSGMAVAETAGTSGDSPTVTSQPTAATRPVHPNRRCLTTSPVLTIRPSRAQPQTISSAGDSLPSLRTAPDGIPMILRPLWGLAGPDNGDHGDEPGAGRAHAGTGQPRERRVPLHPRHHARRPVPHGGPAWPRRHGRSLSRRRSEAGSTGGAEVPATSGAAIGSPHSDRFTSRHSAMLRT